MAIFQYELRQRRWYTFWWSIGCAAAIFGMLPIYLSFLTSGTYDLGTMIAGNDFFDMLGIDPQIIQTPLGTFGFLTSFFAIAGGINGFYLGLSTFTKETVGKSAEFLYTKPFKRGNIYVSKVSAALLSAVIIGLFYTAGAFLSAITSIRDGFHPGTFFLIAGSFLLIEVFFVLMGSLAGVFYPGIRTPLLFSSGAAFLFYMLSALSGKADLPALKYITPYAYFSNTAVIQRGSYNMFYLSAFLGFCILFFVIGYGVFCKKDIVFMS